MILNFLISLSFAANPASTWIVKAPQANPHDFFVYAQNSPDTKVSQAFTTCPHTSSVHQLVKEAQYHFLNGSLSAAEKKFTQLAELKWSCDWKDDERKVMVFSLMRLAQLAPTPAEQLNYVTEAIALDDAIAPDSEVFPPPILSMYVATRKQMNRTHLALPAFTKKFSGILRNGKFVSLNSLAAETYPLRARYTFVSDTYKPETFFLTPEELANYQLEPRPLVEGSCQNFTVSEELQGLPQYKVFFDIDCIKEKTVTVAKIDAMGSVAMPSSVPPLTERKRSWIERNMLWVGAAVVGSIAIATVMKHNESQQTVIVPTNTMGGATP